MTPLSPRLDETLGDAVAGSSHADLRAFAGRALDRARSIGWPSRREEAWKYTDPAPLVATCDALPDVRAGDASVQVPAWGPFAGRLVFRDGVFDALASEMPATGVAFFPSLEDAPEALRARALTTLGGLLEPHEDRFSALLAALAGGASLLHVAANDIVDAPLLLVHQQVESRADAVVIHPVIVFVDRSGSLGIVEQVEGVDDAAGGRLQGLVADVGPNASLDVVRLQWLPDAVRHLDRKRIALARDARFRSFVFSDGAGLSRDDLVVRLDAPGAHAGLYAVSIVGGHRVCDHHTLLDHRSADGTSEQLYRAVADDHGHSVFHGSVFIHPDSQRVNAEQLNRTLMLSRDARSDAKPQLEIFADDVKCAHGATIGQLDPNELFYLASRGIAPARARQLLVAGFAGDLVEKIPFAGLAAAFPAIFASRVATEARS